MNRRLLSVGLLILLLVIPACTFVTIPADPPITPTRTTIVPPTFPPVPTSSEIAKALFEETTTCSLPCWYGITPGITTFSDTLTILENNLNIKDMDYDPRFKLANWEIESGIEARTSINPNDHQEIIEIIDIRLRRYVMGKDVISYLGEPSHLSIRFYAAPHPDPETGSILYSPEILFIYPQKGVYLRYLRTQPVEEAKINTSSFFSGVILASFPPNTPIVEWQGDKPLLEYCKMFEGEAKECSLLP